MSTYFAMLRAASDRRRGVEQNVERSPLVDVTLSGRDGSRKGRSAFMA